MDKDTLIIDNIPFFYIITPPNVYDLKKIEDKARQDKSKLPFLDWHVQDRERQLLLNNSTSSWKTVYVSHCDLTDGKLSKRDRVMGSHPALLDLPHGKEHLKKFAGNPQFSFGLYYAQNELFLMDDIIKWSHCGIYWREIRTVETIVKKFSQKTS